MVLSKSDISKFVDELIKKNKVFAPVTNNDTIIYKEIKKFCGEIPTVLFGNKVDLVDESRLDNEKIQKLVNKHSFIGYYHTSAKTGQNVEKAFGAIIGELQNKIKEKNMVQNQ